MRPFRWQEGDCFRHPPVHPVARPLRKRYWLSHHRRPLSAEAVEAGKRSTHNRRPGEAGDQDGDQGADQPVIELPTEKAASLSPTGVTLSTGPVSFRTGHR